MDRLLTVAMPTFNRAELLDAQFAWFARAVAGREHQVELIVSDNCSTDDTPQVVERWQRALAQRPLLTRFVRNDENVGAIRNIASCMRQARGEFVWTVGDDDVIDDAALRRVLDTAAAHDDLSLLILNFSSRHWKTGHVRFDRCFDVDEDQVVERGRELVEHYLRDPNPSRWGGLVLTTALAYRTETVQAALAEWPEGLDNLTLQLFLTARCALEGVTVLTKDSYVQMTAGRHFFDEDPMMFFRFRIAEIPEAFVMLAQLGYSRALLQQKILNQRKEIHPRRVLHHLVRQPVATMRVLGRHVAASRQLAPGSRLVSRQASGTPALRR